MAWAIATLGMHEQKGFVATLCTAARTKLSAFKPQAVANLAWAVATLHMNMQKGCCCDLHCSTDKGSSAGALGVLTVGVFGPPAAR